MKREFSAGGIVFNNLGQVLLINNAALRDPSKSYWGFPKGHLDVGESSKEAALREVKEETGLEVEILDKLGQSQYVFTHKEEKIFKTVTMFLMKYTNGEVKPQELEIIGLGWYPADVALEKLSFKKDKDFLSKAREIMSKSK